VPNGFAYLMLLIWPAIAAALFRRLPVERALIWSILGAYLILPPRATFDFPLVPALDKESIPNLAAFLCCVVMLRRRVPLLPDSATGRIVILLFVVSPIGTVLTNADAIPYAAGVLPGLRIHDSISVVINQAIAILPFFLARRLLATEAAQREILLALVLAGLAYSLPMLLEVRLSPQLNTWIYGFFQHDFIQMMRQGGFRPIVFLPHGLWAAFFALMALIAALALWRTASAERQAPLMLAAGYLAVLLVLCKSMAVLAYAACLAPLVRLAGRRMQIRAAAALALIAVLFPLLRGADLVPIDAMLAQAEQVSVERAASLAFRFGNEDLLLDHANAKPLFGWGGWGRNRVYDPNTGKDLAVTDGRWIIVIGSFGWCGYIAEFGLLALPLLLLAREARRTPAAALSPHAGPLALILGINMIDMLPNATLIPFTWLLAGALLGHAEALRSRAPDAASSGEPAASALPQPAPPRTIL
jgi:hypothetical protein